jgi:hypothetical protein
MVEYRSVRTAPSAADLELIATLRENDLQVSVAQLERWRALGLLPRAIVVRPTFGGSRVEPHSPAVLEAAALLAQVSARGRPWQLAALTLFDERGTLSTPAVRACSLFLVERQTRYLRKAWQRAEGEVGVALDPDDELADLAWHAGRHTPRSVVREIRNEVRLAHPMLSQSQLREATERAVAWRVADISMPGRLSEEQRNLARHGSTEPMDPIASLGLLPLPSEREACAHTLTWAEASTFREWALLAQAQSPVLQDRFALDLVTWMITAKRLREKPDAPDLPLGQDRLVDEAAAAQEAWAEELHEIDTHSPNGSGAPVGER